MDAITDPGVDEERWLAFARDRSRELRDALVVRYLGLAKSMAARIYSGRIDDTVPFADYLQYARVGLMEAIDSFDPARAVPFEAFSSYRIRGAILNGLASQSELAAQRAYWSRRERDRLESLKRHDLPADRRATLEHFVNLTVGLALGHVVEHREIEVSDGSLAANPYALAELMQLRRAVQALLPALPQRERELIRRHYEENVEFQQIAAEWGVTKGRVSQIHGEALARLRQLLRARPRVDRKL
jgi:RNA polymerase sigma factor for flagellar operon FliA